MEVNGDVKDECIIGVVKFLKLMELPHSFPFLLFSERREKRPSYGCSRTMEAELRPNTETVALNTPGDMETYQRFPSMDLNHYATKKSAAQSMLDVALLMANSSQLITVLHAGPQYSFYVPVIVLLALSITLQVIVGLLLIFIVKYDLNDRRKHAKLETMNNTATVFVFFTVLINIFITALGFQGPTVTSSSSPVLTIPEVKPPLLPPDMNVTGGV